MRLQLRRNPIITPIEGSVILAILVIIALILWPLVRETWIMNRRRAQMQACERKLKQLSQAMLLYAADWDEHRPSSEHWGRSIAPFVSPKSDVDSAFHCPGAVSPYSYAFNRSLSNLALKQIKSPEDTIQLFEADVSSIDASGDDRLRTVIPRHRGLNVACADGHTKFAGSYGLRWQP